MARILRFMIVLATTTVAFAVPSSAADHADHVGHLVLTVDTFDAGAFGYAAAPPSELVGTFHLVLDAPLPPEPVPDGDYEATFASFGLTIGDTSWDATMPHDDPLVRFEGGQPIGWLSTLTLTRPDHPDLIFALPTSPGAWEAIDDDGVTNEGAIAGTYVLAFAAAPTLDLFGRVVVAGVLIGLAVMVLADRRRSRG